MLLLGIVKRMLRKLLISLIFIIGLFVRLYKIDSPVADWHSWRQADTASVTYIYFQRGIDLLYPRYHDLSSIQSGKQNPQGLRFVEFPLYNLASVVVAKVNPVMSIDVASRSVSIIASLFSAYFLLLIGDRFIKRGVGVIASAIFLVMPFNIYFSRTILPEPMAVALSLAGVWFFMLYTSKNNLSHLALSAVMFALALLVKPFSGYFMLACVFASLAKFDKIRAMLVTKELWLFAFVALLPTVLWRLWINQYPEGIPFFMWLFNGDHIRFRPSFFRWILYERLTRQILSLAGVILFIAGLTYKIKPRIHYWLLAGAALYVAMVATANVKHDYYQTFIIPAVALVSAVGVYRLVTSTHLRVIKTIFAVFCLGFMVVSGWQQIRGNYTINHPEIIDAGQAADRALPQDALVIAVYGGDTAFLYQTKRRGWPIVDTSLEDVKARGASYLISVDLNEPNTIEAIENYWILESSPKYVIVDLTRERQEI